MSYRLFFVMIEEALLFLGYFKELLGSLEKRKKKRLWSLFGVSYGYWRIYPTFNFSMKLVKVCEN